MMAAVAQARSDALRPYLRPDLVGIGSINSPMQCMMKQVCAQCLAQNTVQEKLTAPWLEHLLRDRGGDYFTEATNTAARSR